MSQNVAKVFSSLVAVVGILLVGVRDARAQFRFGPPANLGPLVNTGSHEDSPSISADDLSLYFSDPAEPHRPGGHGSSDLWVATREVPTDPWGEPMNLGQVVNKTTRDHAPSISADGLWLCFSDGWALVDPSRPGGSGGPDLWATTRPTASDPWTASVNLGPTVNSSEREVTPFISADGRSLYFSSSRPGGSGDLDIWVTTRATAADPWTTPVNLGPAVNSPGLDGNPSVSPDGLTLFFNSDRPGGVGTHDLWVTTRPSVSDAWGPPVNLGDLVNTTASEYGPSVSSEGSTLYFSSDRGGGRGGRDIWQAPILAWPPRPGFTVSPEVGDVPLEVRVDGAASTTEPGHAIDRYDWDFGDGASATGPLAEHTYSQAGRFSITLTVTDDRDLSWTHSKTVSVGCAGGDVSPWTSIDVGEPLIPGSARLESESGQQRLSLCAAGTPLSGREDSFHFVYQAYSGDAALAARVLNLEGGLGGAQLGLMLRESLEADARYAAMTLETTRFRFSSRLTSGGNSMRKADQRQVELPNAWVKIERQAEELIGSVSTDGSTWEEVDRKTIAGFPERCYGGVFAAGGEPRDASSFRALRAEIAVLESPEAATSFVRGECNGDGSVDISDAVCSLEWLFLGGEAPGCVAATNVNGDATVDISDPVSLLGFLFLGGPGPVAPFPDCGDGHLGADEQLGCSASTTRCLEGQ